MKKRNIIFKLAAIAILSICVMLPSMISGQVVITNSILEQVWVVPDTILPIDGPDIVGSAETTAAILIEVSKSLPDSAKMADYNFRLTEIIGDIDTIYLELEQYDEDDVGSKLLQLYKNPLVILQTSIDGLKSDLDKKSKELSDKWIKIDFISQTWTLTLGNNTPEPLSESLRIRTESILEECLLKKDEIQSAGNELFKKADELLTGSQTMEVLKAKMQETEEMVRRNHLKKTHAALWESDTTESVGISPSFLVKTITTAVNSGYSELYQMYKVRVYLSLVLLILFLFVSFYIKKITKSRTLDAEDERISRFLKVFKKPVSVSLTLALFVSILLYPNAPQIIRDSTSLMILIPLMLVAMQVLPKKLHIHLYVISLLYLFEKIMDLIKYDNYPLPELLILFVLIITLAYVVWQMIVRGKKYKNAAKRRIKLIDIFLWWGLLTTASAIVANVMGYVAFGYYLLSALIISVMAGLLISVSVTIIHGFFSLIIMGNSSQMYGSVKEYGDLLVKRIFILVKYLAIIYWISVVLRRYLIYNEVIGWLQSIFDTKWVLNDDTTFSLKGIISFFFIIFVAIWIARFIRLLLEKEVFPRVRLGRGVPGMISLIIRYTIITIGFILSIGVLGIDMTKLTILFGALGVGIGFGLQDIINNLISGFILIFERPIQVGDTVQFGEREGMVKEIGIRSSIIRTYNGSEVIVPNGKLISNELINLTLSDPILRIEIEVGTEYGTDPQEVIDILVMQAKLHPGVSKSPESFAIFLGFGDFSLNFRLYSYTVEVNSRLTIRSDLNLAISQAFKEAGIKIPFPIQDLNVNLTENKPEKPKKPTSDKK